MQGAAAGLASLHYTRASKLAFGAGPGVFVTSLAKIHDSFDDWRDDAALTGKDFIVEASDKAMAGAADLFSSIEKLAVLQSRGILSEQEYTSKKAELLSRL